MNALAVSKTTAYVGGGFTSVNQVKRTRLAAVSASTGVVTSWAPSADAEPKAMVVTPNQSLVVVGGTFAKLNSTTAYGMGALDARTGLVKPWKINTVVRDYGAKSAILGLTADADTVYGSGYAYGGGNFEGAFAASPTDGAVTWLQDCHGDTYSVAAVDGVVYSAGHAHYCRNIGGFPDTIPRRAWYRALAVTKAAAGTVASNGQPGSSYGNFGGKPAPSLIHWFPDLEPGTFTGQTQSAWSVAGTSSYLLLGGEFTKVNGVQQQGLVRMAIPALAPRKQGPTSTGTDTTPSASALTPTGATQSWSSNSDRDDTVLTYELLRDGAVINTRTAISQFWSRLQLSFVDPGLAPGTTYAYRVRVRVRVRDPDGNMLLSAATSDHAAPRRHPDADPGHGRLTAWCGLLGWGGERHRDPEHVRARSVHRGRLRHPG